MHLPRLLSFSALGAAAIALSSCAGYRLGSDQPARMEGVRTIAVPVLKNSTLEPRSSVLVTNNLVRQFQIDGTYQVTSVEKADAVLRGTVHQFERRQLRSARSNTLRTRETELRLWVDYTVEDGATGAVLMKGRVDGSSNLFLDPNYQLTERQGIDEAARKMAEDLVSRLSEGWSQADMPVPDSSQDNAGPREKRMKKVRDPLAPLR